MMVFRSFLILLFIVAGLWISGCEKKDDVFTEDNTEHVTDIVASKEDLSGRSVSRCLGNSCFDSIVYQQGINFELKGMSRREHLKLFDIYTAAFYLPKGKLAQRQGVPPGPKLIVLEYHRKIPKEKVIESIDNNVDANPRVNKSSVQERFDRLTDAFDPPAQGSRYEFLYIPETGTALIKDSQQRVVIPGDDFAYAFFGVWLSEFTGDKAARLRLLGLAK